MAGAGGKGFLDKTWAPTFTQNRDVADSTDISIPYGKQVIEVEMRGGTGIAPILQPAYNVITNYPSRVYDQAAYQNVVYYAAETTNYPSRNFTQPAYNVITNYPSRTVANQPAYNVITNYPSRTYDQPAYSVTTNYPSRAVPNQPAYSVTTNYPSRAVPSQPAYSVTTNYPSRAVPNQPAYSVTTNYPARTYDQPAYSVVTAYPSRAVPNQPAYSVVTAYPSRSTNQPAYSVTQPAYSVSTFYPSRSYVQAAYSVVTAYPSRITAGVDGTASQINMTAPDGTTYSLTAPGVPGGTTNYVDPAVATTLYAKLYAPIIAGKEVDTVSVTAGSSPAGNADVAYRSFITVKYDGDPS